LVRTIWSTLRRETGGEKKKWGGQEYPGEIYLKKKEKRTWGLNVGEIANPTKRGEETQKRRGTGYERTLLR